MGGSVWIFFGWVNPTVQGFFWRGSSTGAGAENGGNHRDAEEVGKRLRRVKTFAGFPPLSNSHWSPRLGQVGEMVQNPQELELNPWELGRGESREYPNLSSQVGGTHCILSFTVVFGRGRRAALHGDQGAFLAAKPGSSQQGFGIEGGHTVRPGDKQQLRVLVGQWKR